MDYRWKRERTGLQPAVYKNLQKCRLRKSITGEAIPMLMKLRRFYYFFLLRVGFQRFSNMSPIWRFKLPMQVVLMGTMDKFTIDSSVFEKQMKAPILTAINSNWIIQWKRQFRMEKVLFTINRWVWHSAHFAACSIVKFASSQIINNFLNRTLGPLWIYF